MNRILSSTRFLVSSATKTNSPKSNLAQRTDVRFSSSGRGRNLTYHQNGHCMLTYIWIDGTETKVRAKTLVAAHEPKDIKEIMPWNFDGSSTGQAPTGDSDLALKPVAMCRDPFLMGKSKLVLCEVLLKDGTGAIGNNYRHSCANVVEKTKHLDPWFAFEQEYTLFSRTSGRPFGWPIGGVPPPQGPYYCGVGEGVAFGREVADKHLQACLYAGLRIGGTNGEVMPSQWEYQLGPLPPLAVGDQLWLCRYIADRVGEEFGATINLDPKPVAGDWNGAGNHCNFSTKITRSEGGLKHIEEAILKLKRNHESHIEVYDPNGGADNRRRLTGKHQTSSFDKFTSDVGNRKASVRIPRPVAVAGKGYLEDRRPSSNCDPYRVVERILRTICLDEI